MRFTIITPNYNSARYLEQTIQSVLSQKSEIELEYILVDGGSTDGSIDIINKHRGDFAHCIIEEDSGPAQAINKGLGLATGDVIGWLNADDVYYCGTLARVQKSFEENSGASMCFGGCDIIDKQGGEIRSSITRFKELFYPLSSRFTYQCINYISQPSLFFRRDIVEKVGPIRQDMAAAWDYEFILRLWHHGPAKRISGPPLASFRWHEQSISGQHFRAQFREEYDAAKKDAGSLSLQAGLHFLVYWGIVGIYSAMSAARSSSTKSGV